MSLTSENPGQNSERNKNTHKSQITNRIICEMAEHNQLIRIIWRDDKQSLLSTCAGLMDVFTAETGPLRPGTNKKTFTNKLLFRFTDQYTDLLINYWSQFSNIYFFYLLPTIDFANSTNSHSAALVST